MTKYNAKKTTVNGITFDSKLEATRFEQLLWLERAGEIADLILQPEFQVFRGYVNPDSGEKKKSTFYIGDFQYVDIRKHKVIVEDTKGMETADFRLKWKLVQSQYPEYEFLKVTKDMI